jgi:hypothetical protein
MRANIRVLGLILAMTLSVGATVGRTQALGESSKPLATFSKLSFEISGDLEVVPSASFGYTVRAEQKVIDALALVVERDTLKIQSPKGFRTNKGVKVIVRVPRLAVLTSDASGDVTVGGIECKSFKLIALGSGSITANSLSCTQLDIEASGSGDVTVAGKAGPLTVEATGSGSVDAKSLVATDVRIKKDGSGDISVHATKSLTGVLDGAGDLNFRGAVTPKVAVSGAGSVNRLR